MNIITISREFGSGGREVGKRLADALGYTYYDREILTILAEKTQLDANYLDKVLEVGPLVQQYPILFGRTFSILPYLSNPSLLANLTKMMKKIAISEHCVIVGRSANVILEEYNPLRIFVYADMPSKIQRCRQRETEKTPQTDGEYEKKIRQVDKQRAKNHNMLSTYEWGDMRGYDLCLNTSSVNIKGMIPSLSEYCKKWFEHHPSVKG